MSDCLDWTHNALCYLHHRLHSVPAPAGRWTSADIYRLLMILGRGLMALSEGSLCSVCMHTTSIGVRADRNLSEAQTRLKLSPNLSAMRHARLYRAPWNTDEDARPEWQRWQMSW